MSDFLIYGATGYTGSLIARECVRRGVRPILAGRKLDVVQPLAGELGLDHRVFSLDTPSGIVDGLHGILTVLNCAGPFSKTAMPLVMACLKTGTHYLDITGEIAVFESLKERDAEAKAAGIVVLPGVGFDVVPSDCLAVYLKKRLPTATHLVLAFRSSGRLSRGTMLTGLERMDDGGMVRINGILTPVPAAWKTRDVDFGDGPVRAITIPWGDIATAYYSTGIPNIEVYLAAPWSFRMGAKLSRWFGWVLRSKWLQARLRKRILAGQPGPTEAERRLNRCSFWGEVTDETGQSASARMQTPDGYDLSIASSLAAVDRVRSGMVAPGFQTPALTFGPDFALELPGVTRTELIYDSPKH